MALPITWLSVFSTWCGLRVIAIVHGAAGHASLVANTWVVCSTGCCQLGIACTLCGLIPFPEWFAGALGVVVGRRRSITLLFLVMADEEEIEGGADQEEEDSQDGDGEACGVEAASIAIVTSSRSCLVVESCTYGRADYATAFVGSVTRIVRDDSKAGCEKDIENDSQEAEEGLATEEEREDDAEDGIQDGSACHALNSLLPCWNRDVVF